MKSKCECRQVAADGFVFADLSEISAKLVAVLCEKDLTLSTAESCTGGLMGKLITDVPGASKVFSGGVITYTNKAKSELLGVSADTLEKYTEVSFEAAAEMARGAVGALGTDIGISATGFAGPDGGREKDPVGTVYVGVCGCGECFAFRLSFDKNCSRDEIRRGSAAFAFQAVMAVASGERKAPFC